MRGSKKIQSKMSHSMIVCVYLCGVWPSPASADSNVIVFTSIRRPPPAPAPAPVPAFLRVPLGEAFLLDDCDAYSLILVE